MRLFGVGLRPPDVGSEGDELKQTEQERTQEGHGIHAHEA